MVALSTTIGWSSFEIETHLVWFVVPIRKDLVEDILDYKLIQPGRYGFSYLVLKTLKWDIQIVRISIWKYTFYFQSNILNIPKEFALLTASCISSLSCSSLHCLAKSIASSHWGIVNFAWPLYNHSITFLNAILSTWIGIIGNYSNANTCFGSSWMFKKYS